MALSIRQRLENVQTAIARIESGGQSASIGDMSYTEADLGKLYAREEVLERRLAIKSGKRPMFTRVKLG